MRAIKNLFVLAIILAAIGGGAVAALRVARGRPSAPEQVKPNLVGVSAAGMNVYAARAGSKVIVFDTGADPEARPVDAALGALGAGRGDVSDIFITHAHGDHTAGATAFGGAKIHLGAADVSVAEKKAEPANLAPRIMAKVMSIPAITVTDPMTGVVTVDLGGGKSVKAFPVPGHTPGSYVFLYDGVLFAGDVMVFKQGRLDRAPKLFDADPDGAKSSLAALKQQLAGADFDIVCTGHGGCTPKGLGKNLFDDLLGRLGG
jgi:glyoxylase-like metal-dependent hydrolase (beta-lactamase superfamily II)